MTSITPVAPVDTTAVPDPGAATQNAQVQQAFADGIAKFMGSMLMGMQSDIQEACNDTTSDPDAPS